jgi:hypothetical protein
VALHPQRELLLNFLALAKKYLPERTNFFAERDKRPTFSSRSMFVVFGQLSRVREHIDHG